MHGYAIYRYLYAVLQTAASSYTVSNGNGILSVKTNAYFATGALTKTGTTHTKFDSFSVLTTNVPVMPISTNVAYSSKETANVSIRPFTEHAAHNSIATTDYPFTHFKGGATAKSLLTYAVHYTSFRTGAAVNTTNMK